jgi:hypothetical protein
MTRKLLCWAAERQEAVQRLVDMLLTVPWHGRRDIEDCLVEHAADARPLVLLHLPATAPAEADCSAEADAQRWFIRLAHRLES